ncbi:MAG: S4 domain-containing protein, partial [Candidatus Sumerlaeota bacterium]
MGMSNFTDTREIDLHVDPEDTPCRLDRYLAENIDDLSRTRIKKLIVDGSVTVDGHQVKPRHELQGGEKLSMLLSLEETLFPEAENIPLDILYEDEDLLVVNKSADMVVHPGAGVSSGTLVNALIHHCDGRLAGQGQNNRPGIVHRPDRRTSG